MINSCFLSKRLSSIGRIRCFTSLVSAMAPTEWELTSDDNRWNASTFFSAIAELFLSILLLLGAAIAFITSRFVKVFGLEPPCTYIGCSHPLQFESFRGRRVCAASASCKLKNLCTGEFCPDRHPSRFYLKLGSDDGHNHEEESSSDGGQERNVFSSKDHNATQNDDVDASSGHPCSSSTNRRWNQGNFPKHASCVCAAPSRNLNEDGLPLLSARSSAESSGGFYEKDQCEISEVSADSEEERVWIETCMKDDDDASFAHNDQAVSEDVHEKIHGVRVHSSKPLALCRLDDECEMPHLKPMIQRAEDERTMYDDDDDCLGNGLSLASLASLITSQPERELTGVGAPTQDTSRHHWGRQSPISSCTWEGVKEACLQDLEQEVLFMKDRSRGVEGDVLDHAVPTEESTDAPATLNVSTKSSVQSFSLAQCGKLSTHVEGMALLVSSPAEADEDDDETVSEEEGEEGLDALKVALQAERSSLATLEAELENERNAAAVATSEAMAMISRLQEEKSAMRMEVAQLQRMSEAKADYDEQAMELLKEILFKRETVNMALEKEVELYRERLLEEKGDGRKGNWLKEEAGSASPHSLRCLLLADEDDDLSSPMNRQQALVSSAKFYHSGTRSALCVSSMDMEELNTFSLNQNVNKRSRDSPRSDKVVGMSSSTVWNDEGRHRDYWDSGFHGQHKKMGRSVLSMDDEEAQSILERSWALEEELQDRRGKDDSGGQKLTWSKAHEVQQLGDGGRTPDGSLTDVWGGQPACGIKSKGEGEVLDLDGVAGGFVQIHDVYEVHSSSNRSPPCTEEGDSVEGLQGLLRNSEFRTPENFVPARMARARHKTQVPPRLSQTREMPFSDEIPHTPPFTPPAARWIVGKSSYPGSPYEHYDLPSQSLVSREEKRMELEEIQQPAMRLKALEEDRELLRQTLESFNHRDAELSLLQEIAQHLREFRMAALTGVSGGVLQEEVSVTSPSKSRALKKRRYCSGPGQAQMHLLRQKSI